MSLIVPIWIRLLLSYRTKSRSIVISVPADRCVNMERQSDREAGRQVLAHPLQGLAHGDPGRAGGAFSSPEAGETLTALFPCRTSLSFLVGLSRSWRGSRMLRTDGCTES